MKKVSHTYHLIRRNGVWYYKRRVPTALISTFGTKSIQFSLDTGDLKQAKKRRSAEDLKWDAQFDAAQASSATAETSDGKFTPSLPGPPLTEREAIRLVQDYVERTDERARHRLANNPAVSEREKADMVADVEIGAQIVRNRDDPRGDELIYSAGQKILGAAERGPDDPTLDDQAFNDLVRRGLMELGRRQLARTGDDHRHLVFDHLFNPASPISATFGELAEQIMRLAEENAAINHMGEKGLDKQRASLAVIREIVGDNTPIRDVNYDVCLGVRRVLAELPANKVKFYGAMPISEAVDRSKAEGRPPMSPVTQETYLRALRDVLDLAVNKGLIPVNYAARISPIKKDNVSAASKRISFTPEQIVQFFDGAFYRACADHSPPYAADKKAWRFWLPLMCLFMGMRPNEACQMNTDDVKRTAGGTWYLDIVASADHDDAKTAQAAKTLKTAASRRKIPIHPELIAIGFLGFVENRQKHSGSRLFADLKPDKYGNLASYALRRFRENYLPASITLQPRQSFYSFRHSFRDALRRIGAPPDALQALGGWSQGKLTSDDYGNKSDPDYQVQFMKQVAFPGLDLSHLEVS